MNLAIRMLAAGSVCVVAAGAAKLTILAPDGRAATQQPNASVSLVSPQGSDVPYAAEPDWQNSLRIQVGGLAFGDLDGDGREDLAVGTYHSNSFPPYDDWHDYVYFNVDGTLEADPSWQSSDTRHTSEVAIGDIDGDGRNDLVAARGGFSYDPSVVYFGGAAGLATTPGWQSQTPAWAVGMTLVDMDDDGDLDLVTSNQGNGQQDPYRPLYLFRNDGHALSTAPEWQSAESAIANSVAAGDLDGDGLPDLAAARWVNFESAAWRNVGGTPEAAPYWLAGSTEGDRGVAIADFDRDGHNDILLGQGVLTLYRNDGAGGFESVWQANNTNSNHQGLAVADINGDGWPDVAEIDFSRGQVWIHLNRDGVLDADPSWTYDGAGAGTAVAFGDVNGDGLLDLAVGFSGQPSVVVFLNNGKPPPDDVIFADGFDSPV